MGLAGLWALITLFILGTGGMACSMEMGYLLMEMGVGIRASLTVDISRALGYTWG